MAKKAKKRRKAPRQSKKKKQVLGPYRNSAIQNMLQKAIAFHKAGHLSQAQSHYREILTVEPNHPGALHYLGLLFHQMGRNNNAFELICKAIRLKPDCSEAHNNLGLVLTEIGKLEEAAISYQKAITLNPNFVEAHYNMGLMLQEQGKFNEALVCYRKVLTLKPNIADAYYNVGIIKQKQNKFEEAVVSYRRALSVEPNFADAQNNLGVIYSKLGKFEEAVTSYRKALALNPKSAGTFKNLATVVKFTEADDNVRFMEDIFMKGNITDADKIELGFALGKVYENLQDYNKSFNFILEANLTKRKSLEYSIQNEHDFFERIKKVFSPDFFASHHDTGIKDSTPIFIVGMPRSGTTLIEQILASHPLVFGAGELTVLNHLINNIYQSGRGRQFPECMMGLCEDEFERLGTEYITRVRGYSKIEEFITDKMPDNFLRIGLIKRILPNAKVIHCVRNPLDNCFSIFKNDFSLKGANKYAYDMIELGKYYNFYQDLMAHWEKVLPGFIYQLKYEEMVADQHSQSKNLLDFCGLDWDGACIAFHKTNRIVSTASLAQVRQPIYKDSVLLWKKYEEQLEPLIKTIT